MEIQLQELIDQIKKDGVEAAETEAAAILKSAKEEAEKIIAEAEEKADKILASAKAENERMVKSSEDAIRQAGRNLLISFRESVSKELEVILRENVSAVYSSEKLAQLIINVVEAWAKNPDVEDVAVILNSENLKALEETVLAGIKEKMLNLLIADLMGVLHLLIKNMCSEALRHSHHWCSTNAGTSRCPLLEDWDCGFSSVAPQCTVQSWCRAGTWKILGND